jgi:hypothetical protein
MLMKARTIATVSDVVAFVTVPPVPPVGCLPTDGTANRTFDLNIEQLELAWRCCESVGVADQSTSIEKDDHRVLVVEQSVDLFKEIVDISAKSVSKCHGQNSSCATCERSVEVTVGPGCCTDLLPFARGAPSAARETRIVGVTPSCGDGETPFARDRRNVSSLARGPSVASASVHSARASI